MLLKGLLIVALSAPAAGAAAGGDVAVSIGPGESHNVVVDANTAYPQAGGFNLNLTGSPGQRVTLTLDMSTLDGSRVALQPSCPVTGQIMYCDVDLGTYGSQQPIIRLSILSPTPGPAGHVTINAEPMAGSDPDQSNNVSTMNVDLFVPEQGKFTVRAGDVQGAVGQDVTVPVTVANEGRNTLHDVSLLHPAGGGGKDFVGGDGCVLTPVPQCDVGRILAGASKTLKLTFHIRRCYRPVPGDPEYGASVDGGVPAIANTWLWTQDRLGNDQEFRIRVRDCDQGYPGDGQPSVTPGAPASATPSASDSVPADSGLTDSAPPEPKTERTNVSRPIYAGLSLLSLLGATTVAMIHLRRRKRVT